MAVLILLIIILLTLYCSASVIGCSGTSKYHANPPLMLTPYIKSGEVEKARNLSMNEPIFIKNTKSYSGYITVNDTVNWHLFFWYFPVKKQLKFQTPWIVWLQGGPGMSSLYGLFKEIGPLQINEGKVEEMPVTWASDYSLLFIDNPAGTGFSFSESGKYPKNEDEIGESLLNFIQQFVQIFPEHKQAPLFIAGEEYGGKYVTGLARYIHHDKSFSNAINLKGLIIGDGWIDPPNLLHYSEWALQVGLVDHQQAAAIKEAEDMARKYWEEGNLYDYSGKAKMTYNMLKTFAPFDNQNFLKDNSENFDRDINYFLNQKEIKNTLHVGDVSFDFINYGPQKKLYDEIYLPVKPWLEELVEHYGVLCYSGQLDFLMGYALLAESYRNLEWSGREAYIKAFREPIFGPHNTVTGYMKTAGNFMEVMVRGAGQHVPADKPKVAKQAIDIFIKKYI